MTALSLTPVDRAFADRLLSRQPHHVQNSLIWYDFLAHYSEETDRSRQFVLNGNPVGFILALQQRHLIQSLPYPASYAGPLFVLGTPDEVKRACLKLLMEDYAQYADVFSICGSPLFNRDSEWHGQFEYSVTSQIQFIDLAEPSLAGTSSKFRNNLQRNLRKAADAGVELDISASARDLGDWHSVYCKRCEELSAPVLPLGYFQNLCGHLVPTDNCVLINARAGDQYLGGIVVVYNDYCADYYLSMFDRGYDHTQASTAAFDYLLNWARLRGIRFLNLQSSPASQPDLARFKASWGARSVPHRYFVSILNNRDKVLQLSVDQVRNDYLFHFFMPFSALAGKSETVRDREVAHAH